MTKEETVYGKRKGQYMLLSAVVLITLFYTGFYLVNTRPLLTVRMSSDDIRYFVDNLEEEYPKVFNYGVNASGEVELLNNFTLFCRSELSGNILNTSVLWIYTENVTDDLNVTVGNYLGNDTTITVNVSGDVKDFSVASDGVLSKIYQNVPEEFNMTVSFNSKEKKLSMMRDKYNIYVFIELARGNEKVYGGVLA